MCFVFVSTKFYVFYLFLQMTLILGSVQYLIFVCKSAFILWITRQWYRDSAELREEWRMEYLDAWNQFGLSVTREPQPLCATCSLRSLRSLCPWPGLAVLSFLTRQEKKKLHALVTRSCIWQSKLFTWCIITNVQMYMFNLLSDAFF
jgi:hypothetical protein